MDKKATSLTEYYNKFSKSLSDLFKTTNCSSFEKSYQAALEICQQGLFLEQETNPLTMKKIVEEIGNIANKLGPECNIPSFENDKIRQYPLPLINDLPQLMFAIVYLKHLINYETVEYAGGITTYWGVDALSKINEGVQSKKTWNKSQTIVLENNIKNYCQNNEIDFDEIIYQNLSKVDFLTVISKKIKPIKESSNEFSIDELDIEKTIAQEIYKKANNKFNEYNKILLEIKKSEEQTLPTTSNNTSFFNIISNWFTQKEASVKHEQLLKQLKSITPLGFEYGEYLNDLADAEKAADIDYNKSLYKYFSLKYKLNPEDNEDNEYDDKSEYIKDYDICNDIVDDSFKTESSSVALYKNVSFFNLELPSTKNIAIGGAVAAVAIVATYSAI